MKRNKVGWFEIYVQDLAKAKTFYEGVFQTTLEKLESPETMKNAPEMWMFPGKEDVYGAMGAICKMEGVPSGGGGSLIYFGCDDCAVEEARVEASGGKVVQSKFSLGQYGNCAIVSDPDGNMIGLHSEV